MPDNISFDTMPANICDINNRLKRMERMFEEFINKPGHDTAAASEEFLTRKETASILKVSLTTLHSWIKEGKITSYRISSRIRFKRSEVDQFLKKIKV